MNQLKLVAGFLLLSVGVFAQQVVTITPKQCKKRKVPKRHFEISFPEGVVLKTELPDLNYVEASIATEASYEVLTIGSMEIDMDEPEMVFDLDSLKQLGLSKKDIKTKIAKEQGAIDEQIKKETEKFILKMGNQLIAEQLGEVSETLAGQGIKELQRITDKEVYLQTDITSAFGASLFKVHHENGTMYLSISLFVLVNPGAYDQSLVITLQKQHQSLPDLEEVYKGSTLINSVSELTFLDKQPRKKTKNENTSIEISDQSEGEVFRIVETMPGFPGGNKKLFEYLGLNIHYPEEAISKNIQGRVFVNFIVEVDGKISEVKALRPVHPLLDAEAIRVVKRMPRWKPGMQRGKKVRVSYNLPVNFTINEDEK